MDYKLITYFYRGSQRQTETEKDSEENELLRMPCGRCYHQVAPGRSGPTIADEGVWALQTPPVSPRPRPL